MVQEYCKSLDSYYYKQIQSLSRQAAKDGVVIKTYQDGLAEGRAAMGRVITAIDARIKTQKTNFDYGIGIASGLGKAIVIIAAEKDKLHG